MIVLLNVCPSTFSRTDALFDHYSPSGRFVFKKRGSDYVVPGTEWSGSCPERSVGNQESSGYTVGAALLGRTRKEWAEQDSNLRPLLCK